MISESLPDFDPRGTLGNRPLPLLIAQIWAIKRTGTLHLAVQDVTRWIYFEEGFPAAAHDPKSPDFLGSVLLQLGFISETAYNESLIRLAQEKRRQGELLMESGQLTPEQLDKGLRVQLTKKLSRLFALREGEYRFEESLCPPSGIEPLRIQPCALILNSIKHHYRPEDVEQALSSIATKAFRLVPGFDRELCADFGMASEESKDVALLREPWTLELFFQQTKSGVASAKILLLTLYYCGLLEICPLEAVRPPKSRPQPTEARTTDKPRDAQDSGQGKADSEDREKKIQEKFKRVDKEDFFAVLEVGQDASDAAVKKAYFSLAKIFHPDQLSASCAAETRRQGEALFGRVHEAYSVLSHPQKRAEYVKSLAAGTAGGKKETDLNEAKVLFLKAQVFLKKKDITNALNCLRTAMDLDPKNGDYKAYRLWVQSGIDDRTEKSDKDIQRHFIQLKSDLQQIVKDNPLSFFGWKFLAEIHKRLNGGEEQAQCLSKAHRLRPEDVDVNRELRLQVMRKNKQKS